MTISTRTTTTLLWTAQSLLALLFLFAGGVKLTMPAAALAAVSPLPAAFLQFIGVCEVLGAIGLVLPALLNIKPRLTPVAAGGLTIIMIGAVVTSAALTGVATAVMPAVVGVLTTTVARGRWRRLAARVVPAAAGSLPLAA